MREDDDDNGDRNFHRVSDLLGQAPACPDCIVFASIVFILIYTHTFRHTDESITYVISVGRQQEEMMML